VVATIAQIRDGIKARLDTIPGLRAHATMPDVLTAPAAVVYRRSTTFDSSMDGDSDDLTCAVTVMVEYTGERIAQTALDTYLGRSGANSIRAALAGDPTLGGVVDFAEVVSAERDRIVEWAGVKYLAADLVVQVG
jgi:hypothetical protein